MYRVLHFFIALVLSSECLAQAVFDTPALENYFVQSNQDVVLYLHGSACVLYEVPPDNPVTIARNGSAIDFVIHAYVATSSEFCIYPSGLEPIDLGEFPVGNYTISVSVQYEDFFGTIVTQNLGTLSFDVLAIDQAPSNSELGLLILACAIVGVALKMSRYARVA